MCFIGKRLENDDYYGNGERLKKSLGPHLLVLYG